MSVAPGPTGSGPDFVSLAPISFSQKNSVSQVRACVKIDGRVYGIKSYRISKNAHGATNTASFILPVAGNPDWTRELFRDVSAGNQDKPVFAEIWAGFPTNPGPAPSIAGLSRRFHGIVDTYDATDLDTTEFRLRSVAAPLTTDRITTALQNITTVEFVKGIAKPYGIPVFIDPELTNPMTLEAVYAQEFMVGLKNLVKWDTLLRCSVWDDVDVWEDNGTLFYVHPWNVTKYVKSSKTLNLDYGTNVLSFLPSHAPQFNRNIRVVVHSYSASTRLSVATQVQSVVGGVNVRLSRKYSTATPEWGRNGGVSTTYNDDGTVTHSTWSSSGGSASGSNAGINESGLELYDFYLPNLSSTECQALTQAIWRQISQHEYQGEIKIAVHPDNLPFLNIESRFVMAGYPLDLFNVQYWPRTLDESFDGPGEPGSSDAGGWTVSSHCISHTPPLGGV